MLWLISALTPRLPWQVRNNAMKKEIKMNLHEDENTSLTRLP